MKFLSILLSICLIAGCNESNNKSEVPPKLHPDTISVKHCDGDYDSVMIKYSTDFKATATDLNKCLPLEARAFIVNTDTNCLEIQKEYKNFIVILLAKLYKYHLQCCNQGYDLLSMKMDAGSVIINGFEKLSGYNDQKLEMLNSGTIVDYIDKEPSLKNNKTIKELRESIEKEVQRIAKGNL